MHIILDGVFAMYFFLNPDVSMRETRVMNIDECFHIHEVCVASLTLILIHYWSDLLSLRVNINSATFTDSFPKHTGLDYGWPTGST